MNEVCIHTLDNFRYSQFLPAHSSCEIGDNADSCIAEFRSRDSDASGIAVIPTTSAPKENNSLSPP